MVEASGPFESVLKVCGKLRTARCGRGNLFLPPQQRGVGTKLRQRALLQMSKVLAVGKRVAVVWCMAYNERITLWEGVVHSSLDGSGWLVEYDLMNGRLLPFPPRDDRIHVLGGRVGLLPKSLRKRNRKRKSCFRRGYREQRPKIKAMREGFAVSTMNVDTLKCKTTDEFALRKCFRLHQAVEFMRSYGVTIMALQETRLSFKSEEPIIHRRLYLAGISVNIYIMSAIKGYNGMAMLSLQPMGVEKINDRIMKGTMHIGKMKACIFNVYSPTAGAKKEKQESFDEELFDAWHDSQCSLKIICGDMNAPLQDPNGRKCCSERAQEFRKFLVTLGSKSAHQCCSAERKWTYRFPPTPKHPDGLTKQLDHIIINSRFSSAFRYQKVLLAPIPTRHCAVIAGLNIKWRVACKPSKLQPFWGTLRNETICDTFVKNVEESIQGGNKRSREGSIGPALWDKLSSAVNSAAEKLPRKIANIGKAPDSETDSHSLDMKTIVQIARNQRTFDTFDREHGKMFEECVKEECEVIQEKLYKCPKSAYQAIRYIVGENRKGFSMFGENVRDSMCRVRGHFQAIGNQLNQISEPVNFPNCNKSLIGIEDTEFTLKELRISLQKVKSGKASGSDNIPIEALSTLARSEEALGMLLNIINEVMCTGAAADKWKMILQVPLPKKGNLNDLTNWRPICIVNHVVKVMNRMVLERIQPAVENMLRSNQFGFRPHRSTAGAQATFVEIATKASRGEGVAVAFVDFKQAFPSVTFSAIRDALRAFHIPENITKVIMSMYEGLKSYVRTPHGDTESFSIENGTLQGDVLAPYLFIMVLDRIMAEAIDAKGLGIIAYSAGTKSRGEKNCAS